MGRLHQVIERLLTRQAHDMPIKLGRRHHDRSEKFTSNISMHHARIEC